VRDQGRGTAALSENCLLLVPTAWFEMGTSFSLPAMGALPDRIKERFDMNDEGIGTLTSAYFFAAMVGPLVGGYAMDKFGPGIVVILANFCVLVCAVLQASAKGANTGWFFSVVFCSASEVRLRRSPPLKFLAVSFPTILA
jgi:MFS family permease